MQEIEGGLRRFFGILNNMDCSEGMCVYSFICLFVCSGAMTCNNLYVT